MFAGIDAGRERGAVDVVHAADAPGQRRLTLTPARRPVAEADDAEQFPTGHSRPDGALPASRERRFPRFRNVGVVPVIDDQQHDEPRLLPQEHPTTTTTTTATTAADGRGEGRGCAEEWAGPAAPVFLPGQHLPETGAQELARIGLFPGGRIRH